MLVRGGIPTVDQRAEVGIYPKYVIIPGIFLYGLYGSRPVFPNPVSNPPWSRIRPAERARTIYVSGEPIYRRSNSILYILEHGCIARPSHVPPNASHAVPWACLLWLAVGHEAGLVEVHLRVLTF